MLQPSCAWAVTGGDSGEKKKKMEGRKVEEGVGVKGCEGVTERHTDGGETRRKEVGWSRGVKPMCRVCQPCDVRGFFSRSRTRRG